MGTNLKQFNKNLDTFSRTLLPQQTIAFHKKVALDAFARIIKRTPVDTGRAQGNWLASIGSPITREVDVEDKQGSRTISEATKALAQLGIFEVVYISNNVPYILQLEEGSSTQSPEGMVEVTLAELESRFA